MIELLKALIEAPEELLSAACKFEDGHCSIAGHDWSSARDDHPQFCYKVVPSLIRVHDILTILIKHLKVEVKLS